MAERTLKLVFFGAGAFGVPTLRALAAHHEVLAVVTQPDRPAGRGRQTTPTDIARAAEDCLPGVEIVKTDNANEPGLRDRLRALPTDAWVVIAFGQKLSPELLDGRHAMNLHASRLPRWRGAAPINHAVLANDATTGNSVITLAQKMDAGLVLGMSERPIEPTQTAGELHDLLSEDGPALVLDTLAKHASGTLTPVVQDESLVTHARKLSRADGWIDWAQPADECRATLHGLTPWPGVSATIASATGARELKLIRASVETNEGAHEQPGTLIDPAEGLVACGTGTLRLLEVVPTGKRAMLWDAFVRGVSLEPGVMIVCPHAPAGQASGGGAE